MRSRTLVVCEALRPRFLVSALKEKLHNSCRVSIATLSRPSTRYVIFLLVKHSKSGAKLASHTPWVRDPCLLCDMCFWNVWMFSPMQIRRRYSANTTTQRTGAWSTKWLARWGPTPRPCLSSGGQFISSIDRVLRKFTAFLPWSNHVLWLQIFGWSDSGGRVGGEVRVQNWGCSSDILNTQGQNAKK